MTPLLYRFLRLGGRTGPGRWLVRASTSAVLLAAAALLPSTLAPATSGGQVQLVASRTALPTRHGGPVQTHPQVYVVFWDWRSDPLGERSYLTDFLASIGGTSWLATVQQYGAGAQRSLLKGSWSDNAVPVSSHPTKQAVQFEAQRAARHFRIPTWSPTATSNIDVQIVVALPPGGTCDAYHDFLWFFGGSFWGITYTALPYNSDRGCRGGAVTESHELAESITDPQPFSGWVPEIADRCDGQNGHIRAGGHDFFIQKLWSNRARACVL